MSWYDTGTVSVTNGSTAVTGSGTNFVAGAQVGEGFYGPDGRLYEIQAIVSATSLTLADAYLGSTQSGQTYKIVPTQSLTADLASQVSTLISDYQSVADNAGEGKFQDGSATSPGITFTLDQDTGFFRDTANEIGVAVAGVKKAEFNSSGLAVTGSVSGTTGQFSTSLNVDGTVTADGLTVDTNTLYVDSTNNRVAIGTTSPAHPLTIQATTPIIQLVDSNLSTRVANIGGDNGNVTIDIDPAQTAAGSFFSVDIDNSEVMRVDQFGNVGIGVTLPLRNLSIGAAAYGLDYSSGVLSLTQDNSSAGVISVGGIGTTKIVSDTNNNGTGDIIFETGAAEAMRIDASGSLLVGKTTTSSTVDGVTAFGVGAIEVVRSSNALLYLNRKTSDGDIAVFRKDGTPVGSIGTNAGNIYLTDGARSLIVDGDTVKAGYSTGGNADAAQDLGSSSVRWRNLYLSGGVYLGGAVAANKLDDYEEGSFTPVVADAASGGNEATYLRNVGYYTKVGRQVTIIIELTNIDTTGLTGTNDMYITGLPFTSDSPTGAVRWVGSMQQNYISLGANTPYLTPTVYESYDSIRITEHGDNTSGDTVTVSQLTSGSADMNITLTYFTS